MELTEREAAVRRHPGLVKQIKVDRVKLTRRDYSTAHELRSDAALPSGALVASGR